MNVHSTLSVPAASRHTAQFYRTGHELLARVATFVTPALLTGAPAVVIATPEHRNLLEPRLSDAGVNVSEARRLGDLVMLDADETLSLFMVNGMPDAAMFHRTVTGVFNQLTHGHDGSYIRAYGEMVNVLWKRGQCDAAIRLEVLWNSLAATHNFELLCGYDLGNFYKQTGTIEQVCAQHAHSAGLDPVAVE